MVFTLFKEANFIWIVIHFHWFKSCPIFSSTWLCQQSSPSFSRAPSVRRSSVASIISEVIAWISFKFNCGFPWTICRDLFCHFWLFYLLFYEYFSFSFNMGPHRSENFKTLLFLHIAAESWQTFPEFSSQWSSQKYISDFWNLKIEILKIRFG